MGNRAANGMAEPLCEGREVIVVGGAGSSFTKSVVGGAQSFFTRTHSSKKMYVLSIETGNMEPLKKPNTTCPEISAAVSTNVLYVWTKENDDESVIWRYDSVFGRDWERIDASKRDYMGSQCCSGLVALDGCLYSNECIGSFNSDHGHARRLRRYNVEHSIWSPVEPMPEEDTQGVLVVVARRDNSKWIYTLNSSGGVYRYDPEKNVWCERARLPMVPSAAHNIMCCAFDEKIFVIDRAPAAQTGSGNVITTPQVYDVAKNKWQLGQPLNRNYLNPAALLVLNGRLTFIDQSQFPLLNIERYCPDRRCWEIFENTVKLDSNLVKEPAHFQQGALTVRSS